MTTSTIDQTFYDPRTSSEDRAIYFKTNGNDSNDGLSPATAVKTLAQAIVLANALTPTPASPVSIISDSSDNYEETAVIPDNVNVFAPGIRLIETDVGPILTVGNNSRIEIDTITNEGTGDALFFGTGSGLSRVSATAIQSNGGIAINHTGNAFGNAVNCFGVLGATTAIRNSSTSTLNGMVVNTDYIFVSANNGKGVESLDANPTYIDADAIVEVGGALTGTTGIECDGIGRFDVDEIICDTAFISGGGGDVAWFSNCVQGDITIGAGSTVNAVVAAPLGGAFSVVVTGTLNANIGGARYGSYALPGGGDVNGPGSSVDDNVVLFDGITGKLIKDSGLVVPGSAFVGINDSQALINKSVNGVTLSNAGAASDYLDETGFYSTPPNTQSAIWQFGANSVGSSATTRYLVPGYASVIAPTAVQQITVPRAGTLKNMFVYANTPGGNGDTVTYTLRKNGVAQSLAVAMASTANAGSDTSNTVTVAQGDEIDIEVTKPSISPGSPNDVYLTMEFTD